MDKKIVKVNNGDKDIYQIALYDKTSDRNYIILTVDPKKAVIAGSMLNLTTAELREAIKDITNVLEQL